MRENKITALAPNTIARSAAILWLACIVFGLAGFALIVPQIVRGDAAATAANISADEFMFRIGIVGNLLSNLAYLGVTALLYALLKPVNAAIAFCAACFGLAGVAFSAAWPLAAVTATNALNLSLLSLQIAEQIFVIGMAFFGIQILLAGVLIARSGFLPRWLGYLLSAGGATYVINSLVTIAAPEVGSRIAPFIMGIALLGEGSVTLWLLLRGVDEKRWLENAGVMSSQTTLSPA